MKHGTMRTEQEMYDLILNQALQDERILAVYMNGSRTNINATTDMFQDYDVVYVVKETESFIKDKSWIDCFGKRLFMQYPDENDDYPNDKHNSYGYLMQFADGNRIDLTVQTVAYAKKVILEDKLCKILLDKEHILPEIPEATDEDHWVKKPTMNQFFSCCNEFWWCLDNVAKGLWRSEMPYVLDMINYYIRPQLVKLLSWKIGILTDFSCSIGKSGKYMHRWLSSSEWNSFLETYSSANEDKCWNSVFLMCNLFHETAKWVAKNWSYTYNQTEAENCMSYLQRVRELPKTAKDFN